MENMNYSKILSEIVFNNELNTKTMMYRVNGFFDACSISSKYNDYEIIHDTIDNKYYRGLKFNSGDDELQVFANLKYDKKNGDYLHLTGESSEWGFVFDNYYGKKKIDKRIIDIPFYIELNSGDYYLKIKTVESDRVEFYLEDSIISKHIHFYANVFDFSRILKLIKNFVNNPELVFRIYEEIFENKKVVFTDSEVKKGIENDSNLDKPMGKIKKKIKILTNND